MSANAEDGSVGVAPRVARDAPARCRLAAVGALAVVWVAPHTSGTMATVIDGDFEWDSVKAAANLLKHGVLFAEAATVFADPFAVYFNEASGAGRMVVIGTSLRERLLFVVHVERGARDSHHQRATGDAR